MKQIEKQEVEVMYCDFCHQKIQGSYMSLGSDDNLKEFHSKCIDKYTEITSKKSKARPLKPYKIIVPKSIRVKTKDIQTERISILKHYLNVTFKIRDNSDYHDLHTEIDIFYLEDLETALQIMLHLEQNNWEWTVYKN